MWLLYLSADAVALFSIGLITNRQADPSKSGSGRDAELLVFWAPFLLLHLGGPDAITALALEDNQLWHRHALQLVTQIVVTLYVFGVSISRHNRLLGPTILIFIDGCIKYIERTCALYFASLDGIRGSLKEPKAPTYDTMVEEYHSAGDNHMPTRFEVKYGPSDGSSRSSDRTSNGYNDSNLEWHEKKETTGMVEYAYFFYEKSKGLLADAFLSLKDDGEIREFFLTKPVEEALKIVEIELNFIYDVLHTKAFLINSNGSWCRVISFVSVVSSLLLFCFHDKKGYDRVDVRVTFALLGGAIALDLAATVMFLCSDWSIIMMSQQGRSKVLKYVFFKLQKWFRWAKDPYCKRWSKCISSYNLLERSFKHCPRFYSLIFIHEIKDILIGFRYVKNPKAEPIALKFIIEEVRQKAELAIDKEATEKVCSARGDLVFQDEYFLVSKYLLPWTTDVDYDASLLTWHLATDICYWSTPEERRNEIPHCKISKQLSDYMSYLLLREQGILSQMVGNSKVRFEDTIEDIRAGLLEANKQAQISEDMIEDYRAANDQTQINENDNEKFSRYVLEQEMDNTSALIAKAKDSQSVYHKACRLAKQLNMFGGKQWEIMSKVWVELLCYASIRSSARSHFALLGKGGELITLVWLFMVHLGFREPYQPSRGLRSTKLSIAK
ncbi:uncharacterized protein LOC130798758 [Amaranthus tricolor]|uniref:uncharacterized protein LOC130798758 n=1 Tax=Amaranthus tricolor TaxID=29722 RepID=UPI0025850657|nr:uncharacterized protein LOC130798758 [Amaranthus tricolor]